MRSLSVILVCILAVFACESESAQPLGGDSGVDDADAAPGVWQTAVSATWSLPAGTRDTYICVRQTVPETVYVTGLRALSPTGTHHTVLTVSDSALPDGQFECDAFNNEDTMLFASGVGSDEYHFPDGVAVKVEAGQQLFLNIHLYNASDEDYVDHVTGTELLTASGDSIDSLAEMIFAGSLNFSIPGNGIDYSSSGDCVLDSTATIVNVWPHMHQVGKHMKVTHNNTVIHDESFSFTEQRNYPIDPVAVKAGDRLRITCTWNNTTGSAIKFGDSSTDEMCFAGFYRYPATGDEGVFCDLPL